MSSKPELDTLSLTFHLADSTLCRVQNFGLGELARILEIEQRASQSPWSEQNFSDSISSSHLCYAVLIESKCVGFAIFSLVSDEAEILLIAVDPEYQGRGIAKSLIALIERQLVVYAQQIFLEVRQSNVTAIGLYESIGFNCLGERKNYYPALDGSGQREAALIYAKTLVDTI